MTFITVCLCESYFCIIGHNLPSGSALVSPTKMGGIWQFQKQVSEQKIFRFSNGLLENESASIISEMYWHCLQQFS